MDQKYISSRDLFTLYRIKNILCLPKSSFFSECNPSFSNQIQPVDSKNSSNHELISTEQRPNQKPEKSTQTKYPKYIPFDLTKDTENFKIRSKLNDFHQNIEQMYKILLTNQNSEESQMPQAKLSHLEMNLNQMKEEILILLYTNPQPGFRKNLQPC